MNAADLLCLTSHNEGFPNVILEAMASGTPVVAVQAGGNPEAVSDQETGFLVPVVEAPLYAEVVRSLIDSPIKRRHVADRATQAVRGVIT